MTMKNQCVLQDLSMKNILHRKVNNKRMNYSQEPTHTCNQATGYRLKKYEKAREFSQAVFLTGSLQFVVTKKGSMILLFSSKSNLMEIIKESQI